MRRGPNRILGCGSRSRQEDPDLRYSATPGQSRRIGSSLDTCQRGNSQNAWGDQWLLPKWASASTWQSWPPESWSQGSWPREWSLESLLQMESFLETLSPGES